MLRNTKNRKRRLRIPRTEHQLRVIRIIKVSQPTDKSKTIIKIILKSKPKCKRL